ncbi:hypothetical protein [Paenibacillus sp. J22TS3]|uniref:hypothetical protein n=1 Tax=Paenibacillus sp. J22TS3 TaxID=2807192 RepID=UPI001B1B0137|nr:hypothetical protein [Paenibacillus sp. J22TS3]GIP20706.1 hypothetical protein J22TS3_09810 [Paenibacillus sp. J22TS3]
MSDHVTHQEDEDLVTQRDIDKDSGMFVEGSYPDSVKIPDRLAHERPDGTRPSLEESDRNR